MESFTKIAAIILDFWAFSKIESHIFLELSRTLFGLFSDLSSTFSRSVILFSVQPWQSFSLFSCYEHNGRTERKSESDDRPSHSSRCLLQRLPESFGLEVWESLWGNTEIQRGQIRTGKVQDQVGKFLAPSLLKSLICWSCTENNSTVWSVFGCSSTGCHLSLTFLPTYLFGWWEKSLIKN